jgi:hypothetical protein
MRAALAIAGALLIASASAAAQERLHLSSGFTPDPVRLTGHTRGEAPIEERGPGCRGFGGASPDHVLTLDGRFGFLRFFVVAPGPVTLAIRGPDGRFRCDGEPLEGTPAEQGVFEPGEYEVWVGSRQRGAQVGYELFVTEFHSVGPSTGRGDEDVSLGRSVDVGLLTDTIESRYGRTRLRRNFIPDPVLDHGLAGGPIEASPIGGSCRGRVEAEPSHVLFVAEELDYFRIEVDGAPGQVTLIVRSPDGRFFCSAPTDANPFVEAADWARGRYLVWVGSRSATDTPRYRIMYSETRPVP